jgi:NAD(P)H dehydrogenase (quinone)
MSIVVTGATGELGKHVIAGLLEKVPAGEIVAAVRNVDKAAGYAAKGVVVREADYSKPETLTTAFAGATKVLLISASEVGKRFAQHKAVVDAAKAAGVQQLVYTSVLDAQQTALVLAPEHKATEEYIEASGVPFTILRNGWYNENYAQAIQQAVQFGALTHATGEGRVSAASRADFAAAAVAVLTGEDHLGKTYELAGDASFSHAELAAEIAKASGKDIANNSIDVATYTEILKGAGLEEGLAGFVAALDDDTAKGLLESKSTDLHDLIGHATKPIAATVAEALA